MPDLLILRLHPRDPMPGASFTPLLGGLTINVYDLTVGNSRTGVLLGTASGLADPHLGSVLDNTVDINHTQILQHYANVTIGLTTTRKLEAAATAVVVAKPPAGHPEYPKSTSYDLRFEVTRGGLTIQDDTLDFNVTVQTVGSLSTDQTVFFGMPASALLTLPPASVGLDPSLAYVALPANGQPPSFDAVRAAVDLVLAKDPGGTDLVARSPLTAAECQQIASEIIWNRTLYPPPSSSFTIGELYTQPPNDPTLDAITLRQAQQQFAADDASYHASHDADAAHLASFVSSASAAVVCEQLSAKTTRAGLTLPLVTGAASGTVISEASVVLTSPGPLVPSFIVPAAYFYALGATLPPQISPQQRYDVARLADEARLLLELGVAIDAGVIAAPAGPVTVPAAPKINADQAARRLAALGATTGSQFEAPVVAPVTTLVGDWLAYAGTSATIDSAFWTPEIAAQPAAYLALVLEVVTENWAPLIAALKGPPFNVASVAALVAITDQGWSDFFLGPSPPPGTPPRVGLLPPFTQPGSPPERVQAFIRHLERFFTVATVPTAPSVPTMDAAPTLALPLADVFQRFTARYTADGGGSFLFGSAWNQAAFDQAVGETFPADRAAQDWLRQALTTINALFQLTAVGAGELQFSLIEALFARGFTGAARVLALSGPEFQQALIGTVAYPYAGAIYALAGTAPPPPPLPPGFAPINPDGELTDCIPPPHLSPLGPVEYLAELLRVSATSTCASPFGGDGTLGGLLAGRRGPLGDLLATRANLETPLPLIDLVNESLEALAAGLPAATGGAVYNTSGDALGDHRLRHGDAGHDSHTAHDPQTLFAAIPEHSSPAAPVAQPAAYDRLAVCFTAPALPYAQPLDVCRSHLELLGTTRFATMRRFRRDITELAIEPALEPGDFQRHLWRLPVRFDIALEYLQISASEYQLLYAQDIAIAPAPGKLVLRELYGFPEEQVDGVAWFDVACTVPEFLARTGLTYCEFLELWRGACQPAPAGTDSSFVVMQRAGDGNDGGARGFPDCLPCCPDRLRIAFPAPQDPLAALRMLAVFIRLWRRLQALPGPRISFAELRDICDVLGLFRGGAIQPGFLRQLAALLMLRDDLGLALSDGRTVAPGVTGAARSPLLALWLAPGTAQRSWALARLLDRIEDHAERHHGCRRREPELLKLLARNLDALSRLAGFDPDVATDTWHAQPTSTLRFVEVLSKIYGSEFTVGEILFLFGNNHLDGDDPLPLGDRNEALDLPFELPDDDHHRLWALRHRLLQLDGDPDAREWSWPRIESALRHQFGFAVAPGALDPLTALGERFFPSIVERHGHAMTAHQRRFRAPLAPGDTSPLMWNTLPGGPFHHDGAAGELWAELPLRDDDVLRKLGHLRQLTAVEQRAVRDVYFGPRVVLAPFASLFDNFGEAVDRLIEERDEDARFEFFQRQFARFHRRCAAIAEHLADHVAAATDRERCEPEVAWRVLRDLFADENRALAPWENDAGTRPPVTWQPLPSGGAFAALLGLIGTGLHGEFEVEGYPVVWHEVRGPLAAFGRERDRWNAPVPCVIPALDTKLGAAQDRFAVARNGLAMRDSDGEPLGGAQPFAVRWSGALLVEHAGSYRFHAGAPAADHAARDASCAERHAWRVVLTRGQKTWTLLNHGWPGEAAPASASAPLVLRRGVYHIVVEFRQCEPVFARVEDVHRAHTGFEVKYCGPDTGDRLVVIPRDRLFRELKHGPLAQHSDNEDAASRFLALQYTSTLRDIRRTYQRAFKAILFAHRFRLSARPLHGERQSELGFMLDHPDRFVGTSYYRATPFGSHRAGFDFNFLPVSDPYHPPQPSTDEREHPHARRQAALFDWWERGFDHGALRREVRAARERPAWLLFLEAAELQPDAPTQLLRHLGIDIRHAPLVLRYFAAPPYDVQPVDLEDERWAIRTWQGEKWLRSLERRFHDREIGAARPDRWASDDPGTPAGASGNQNLIGLVQDGCLENGDPRRYGDVKRLDDGLRERARAALLAYLLGMNRVALPWAAGVFATTPRDLSDLLLQDVGAGLCERASRIEDAISAVQAFVQRARLTLEPTLVVTPAFALLWDRRFASFGVWEDCKRRELYRENWIEWDELELARRSEAFRFLERELRQSTLTVPRPGGLEWWPGGRAPLAPSLTALQVREPSQLRLFRQAPRSEGLGLLGTPQRDAQPSWLAPILLPGDDGGGDAGANRPPATQVPGALPGAIALPPGAPAIERLPLWFQAAVRLGTRFVRVAAAGCPPASTQFVPEPEGEPREPGCCVECDRPHRAVVDEYYFWLVGTRVFDDADVQQDATQGVSPPDMVSDWERPDKLPGLLRWTPEGMVHLHWCRVHDGELGQPRRSDEGLQIDPALLGSGQLPQLELKGRTADSLRFEVSGGKLPVGYGDPTPPGFRYDLADDSAVVLPLVVAPPAPDLGKFPGGLAAYPFFAYVSPGARIEPPSLFSVALSVAGALRTHCQFEAGLRWYELAFDPLRRDNTWLQCAVDVVGRGNAGDGRGTSIDAAAPAPGNPSRIDRGDQLPCCPSAPVGGAVARQRSITLHYLETLLQWADALLCHSSPEAVQRATVILHTLQHILGARPLEIQAHDDGAPAMPLRSFQPRPAALNPRLLALYDRTADRLALIHDCNDGQRLRTGRPDRDMPYWGDRLTRDGWRTTSEPCRDDDDWCLGCCNPYRFSFLVQKAMELSSEVRALGAELLAAYEKGDAEHLAALRATQDRQLQQLALQVRQDQWRDADWQVQALGKTKQGAQARLRYYQGLIADGLNSGETTYQALTAVSIGSRVAGNVVEAIAQSMNAVPDIWYGVAGFGGTPLFYQQLPIGSKLGGVFSTGARILTALAEIAGTSAGLSLTEGGWDRREQEWREQVEVIGIEIEQIERQILGAERRRNMALRELNNQQRQIDNATEVQNFLRDKFTSRELYLYLQQETAALHFQMYELALRAARQAERAFNYERGYLTRRFLPERRWDNLHEGLLAGEQLQLAVRTMEKAYLDLNCREYELTKHLSLRLHFPLDFLELLLTGRCEITVPEWAFDLDYPGQYLRRIKSVTLTIPCVVGPYATVHCRLTLLSSVTRIDPRLDEPPGACCPDEPPHPPRDAICDCFPPPRLPAPHLRKADRNGYAARPSDPRIVRHHAATEAIATSSGQNDGGLFELNFRDERYLPFEFAGAISRWRLELPRETNFFDLASVSDVVLHLGYTAREGGDALRRAASASAARRLPDGGWRLLDARRDFAPEWTRFRGQPPDDRGHHRLELRVGRELFPFVPGDPDLWITRLCVLVEIPDGGCVEHHPVKLELRHRHGCQRADRDCFDLECVNSEHCPAVYRGALEIAVGPLRERAGFELVLRFDAALARASRLFLVLGYEHA